MPKKAVNTKQYCKKRPWSGTFGGEDQSNQLRSALPFFQPIEKEISSPVAQKKKASLKRSETSMDLRKMT